MSQEHDSKQREHSSPATSQHDAELASAVALLRETLRNPHADETRRLDARQELDALLRQLRVAEAPSGGPAVTLAAA